MTYSYYLLDYVFYISVLLQSVVKFVRYYNHIILDTLMVS